MIESALVQVGRSVVTPAIRLWLTRQQRTADRSLPLAEMINRQVTDAFTRRKVEREVDKLVDRSPNACNHSLLRCPTMRWKRR